jgi:hypothetical protein
MQGINAELVTEYAKDKVWEEDKAVFDNQIYIFGKQCFRLSRLDGKVDVAVTDSPILLSEFYNQDQSIEPQFKDLVMKEWNRYGCFNYFVKRAKPYNPSGRFQTKEESDNIHLKLKQFMNENGVSYSEVNGTEEAYKEIAKDVGRYLDIEKTLKEFDVSLKDERGVFKNLGNLLDELSKKWDASTEDKKKIIEVEISGRQDGEA